MRVEVILALLFLAQVSNVQGTQQVVPITVTNAENVTFVCPTNHCVCYPDREIRGQLDRAESWNERLTATNMMLSRAVHRLTGSPHDLPLWCYGKLWSCDTEGYGGTGPPLPDGYVSLREFALIQRIGYVVPKEYRKQPSLFRGQP